MRKGEEAAPELSEDGVGAQVAGEKDSLFPTEAPAEPADGLLTVEEVRAVDPRLAAVLDWEQSEAEFAYADPLAEEEKAGQTVEGTPGEEAAPEQALPDPRSLDFRAMSPEQRDATIAQLSQTPEGRAILAEGWLREQDYTEKNQRRADAERELEALKADYEERLRRLEELRAAPEQPNPTQPPPDMDVNRFIYWFTEAHGRQPTELDYVDYRLGEQQRLLEARLAEHVGPVRERIERQELEGMATRFERQMEALRRTYPRAAAPEVREAIIAELDRSGLSMVPDEVELLDGERVSAVEKAYLALAGRREIAAAQAARTEQAQQAQATPTLPPGLGTTEDLEDQLDAVQDDGSIEVVAQMQKHNPNLLRRVMESMRG